MSTQIPRSGLARNGIACCLLLAVAALEGCGNGGGGSAPVNLPPVVTTANSCNYATGVNQIFNGTGSMSLSAMDPEGQPLSYEVVTGPATGNLVLNSLTGEFTFDPAINNRSTVTFTYRACETAPSTVCSSVETYTIVHTPRIMPLGDSITDGANTSTTPIEAESVGYRKPLKEALSAAGYATDFVGTLNSGYSLFSDSEHDGHGGCTADDLLNATGFCTGQGTLSSWLNTAKPDVVLLHIGTNDISNAGGFLASDVNDVEAILNNIDSWESSGNWPVTVIISRIITNQEVATNETTLFNNAVVAMAEARTMDKLEWVDHQANVNTATDYGDMLHPNVSGYAKMRDVWLWPLTGTLGTTSGNHGSAPGILPKCP